MIKRFILIGICCISLLATTNLIFAAPGDAEHERFMETVKEGRKAKAAENERKHQQNLEMIDRGASPAEVRSMRQREEDQAKMRQMQNEINMLKGRQHAQ